MGSGDSDLWGAVAVTCGKWCLWSVGSGGCDLWGVVAVTCGERWQ